MKLEVQLWNRSRLVGTVTIDEDAPMVAYTGAGAFFKEYAYKEGSTEDEAAIYEFKKPSVEAWRNNKDAIRRECESTGLVLKEA